MKQTKIRTQLSFLPYLSQTVISILLKHDKPLKTKDIATECGATVRTETIYTTIQRLVEQKLVLKIETLAPYDMFIFNNKYKDTYLDINNKIESLIRDIESSDLDIPQLFK